MKDYMTEIQKEAAISTAKFIGSAIAVACIFPILLFFVPLIWLGIGAATAVFCYITYLFYEFEVSRITLTKGLNRGNS